MSIFVSCPLGFPIPKELIPAFTKTAGLKYFRGKTEWHDRWVFVSEDVVLEKMIDGKRKILKVAIPVRWYNFEYWFKKEMLKYPKDKPTQDMITAAFNVALKKTDNAYLPDKLGVSSYNKLMEQLSGSTQYNSGRSLTSQPAKTFVEQTWEDALAKGI